MSVDAPPPHATEHPEAPPSSGAHTDEAPPKMTFVGWLLGFVLRSCVLFLVYALSIGPLYWQWYRARFAGGSRLLAAFYEPLVILGQWIDPFGKWMDWYVNFWIA